MDDQTVERRAEAESVYADHLERSARQWDRWSDWYTLSEEDFAPVRRRAIEQAGLATGDHVIDIGCGPGVNFEPLTRAIGSEGRITAVDYSPEMIDKAQDRIYDHGWEHIDVCRADVTTADLGGSYDAAMASLSLSVMPDVSLAIENIRSSLEPGAPLIVVDVRPFPRGARRAVNPILRRFLRWYANWNPDGDVSGSLSNHFEITEPVETMFGGAIFSTIARESTTRTDP